MQNFSHDLTQYQSYYLWCFLDYEQRAT